MDILYYSNYCKHSQKIIQTLVKNNMKDKISYVCIDKRKKDPNDNQVYVYLENGTRVTMPPNLHSVPALLLVNNSYQLIYGDAIVSHFHPQMKKFGSSPSNQLSEPHGYHLGSLSSSANILSERYTDYSLTPDELSAKGNSASRKLYNYVSAQDSTIFIDTPPDDYRPDKVSNDVTLDTLQQQRMDELGLNKVNPQLSGQI
jgi:hypothetical protein